MNKFISKDDLNNNKKKIIVMLIIVIMVIVPFIVDSLVYKKELFGFYIEVNSNQNEWFSFWGSYIGAIAAVILGVIALYQNHVLASANSELNRIQEKYFSMLSSPIISFAKIINSKYDNSYCEDDSEKSKTASYVLLNDDDVVKETVRWNHAFEIYIINESNIPLEGFNVDYAEIKVNYCTYRFEGLDYEEKISRLIRIDDKYKLNLVIAYPRVVSGVSEKFNDIEQLFETGSESEKIRYSQLTIKFKIINQLGYVNSYHVKFNLRSELPNQYIIKEYVISTSK